MIKICPRCKKEFEQTRKDRIYCSPNCGRAVRNRGRKQKRSKEGWRRRWKRQRERRKANGTIYYTASAYKEIILSLFDNKCQKCGSKDKLHVHHIVPRFLGGKNHIKNITILCLNCHYKLHHE